MTATSKGSQSTTPVRRAVYAAHRTFRGMCVLTVAKISHLYIVSAYNGSAGCVAIQIEFGLSSWKIAATKIPANDSSAGQDFEDVLSVLECLTVP